MRDPEALAGFREAVKEQTHDRGNQHTGGKRNNVTLAKPATGNGKAYTLSRLKRETPELFAAVVKGEMSANAADLNGGTGSGRKHTAQTGSGKDGIGHGMKLAPAGTGAPGEDATKTATTAEVSANPVPTSAKKSSYFGVFRVIMRFNGTRPQTLYPSGFQRISLVFWELPY